MQPLRRVITGLDAEGRSAFQIDGSAEMVIWSTDATPANNSGTADEGGPLKAMSPDGTRFVCWDVPPGGGTIMHATDTIDYVVVVSGEIRFITETGDTLLRAGDVLVDRGIVHGWSNDGDAPCRAIIVNCPALPVGKGATILT